MLLGGRNVVSKIEMLIWGIQFLSSSKKSFIIRVWEFNLDLNLKGHIKVIMN